MKKEIKDFELYSISTEGVVTNEKTGKILKPIEKNNGYLQVNLSIKGRRKAFLIHQLVAETFLNKPEDYGSKIVINHKDGNKWNNVVDNLEYVTQKENVLHAVETGLMSTKGEKSWASKLTNDEANVIRKIYKTEKISMMKLAKRYNVSERTIGRIIHNISYNE